MAQRSVGDGGTITSLLPSTCLIAAAAAAAVTASMFGDFQHKQGRRRGARAEGALCNLLLLLLLEHLLYFEHALVPMLLQQGTKFTTPNQ